ncbi:MAG: UDP-N-acetylmuramate--L-alanine ligase [Paludibacteraceae bacterium]|nr:UDP-N-acetylmuramate--L-alanine ligase [Paludibacteraceae bacterium]
MVENYYFLGIGGIGMSAIARYFKAKGFNVAGYDRTASLLTHELEKEGIALNYSDEVEVIPSEYKNPDNTFVVFTPAIPKDNVQYNFFVSNNFVMQKRAQVLGDITRRERGLCVAGTHGKTTTSTMIAHILKQSHVDCNAFLGGISKNYTSNLLLSDKSDLVVIEADEFDRSFHHLSPYMAVVTATDADHLDIYGTYDAYVESFNHFTSLVQPGGVLIMKKGIVLNPQLAENVSLYTYSATEKADFYADNIRIGGGKLLFDFIAPTTKICDVDLGVPVLVNVENAVAAMAVALLSGTTESELKAGIASFAGIRRRFEIHYKSDKFTLVDDYAHHPKEIEASLKSINALYNDRKIVVVFQPHLFTRTRDFYADFAKALSVANQVVLVEIYPAREKPIDGVSSKIIFDEITSPVKKITTKKELIDTLDNIDFQVLLVVGAGDIDTLIPSIIEHFK